MLSIDVREFERNVPAGESGGRTGQQRARRRAYLGVYCLTCRAQPGEWCRRLEGPNVPLLRKLHAARLKRLAALDRQGWKQP